MRIQQLDTGRSTVEMMHRASCITAVTYSLIVSIVIVKDVLRFKQASSSKATKRKKRDLLKAKDEIAILKRALNQMKSNIIARHRQLNDEVHIFPTSVSIQPSMPSIFQT